MAYQTGTASSMNDLMSVLSTFAVANGWTQDQYVSNSDSGTHGKLSLHKSTVYVHFWWNSYVSPCIGVYHSLGYAGSGVNQYDHTDDCGNGPPSAPSTSNLWNLYSYQYRHINNIGNGPYTSYFFFQGNGSEDYIHVVLEFQPFTYRHFGFGIMEKSWDWIGGEYCYGHSQQTSNPQTQPFLLPSYETASTSYADRPATVHAEGLPGQPALSKWATFAQMTSYSASFADRAGQYQMRFVGGIPSGFIGHCFNSMPSNSGDGFLPLTANAIFYRDIGSSPNNLYLMGFQPDVRSLNMKGYDPKDEITISSDTWKIFPAVRKQYTGDINESRNLGIAYKKIT